MTTSPRLALDNITRGQAQSDVPINDAINKLSMFAGYTIVKSMVTSVEPSSPVNGDAYVASTSPSGTYWDNFSENDVIIDVGGWYAWTPTQGWQVYDTNSGEAYIYTGSAWVSLVAGLTGLDDIEAFFNGTLVESFDTAITVPGGTPTLGVEQSGGGDLTMRWSSGNTTLDCTPITTIALTAGTDTAPQSNYIYLLESSQVLTKSTSGWPATEHIKIAYLLVPSGTFVSAHGCYINQSWNDHSAGTDGQGHMSHMAERIRLNGAKWYSGVGPNGTDSYISPAVAGPNDFKSTSGFVYQMHKHTVPAIDTGGSDKVLIKNWSGTPWNDIADLYLITADSGGVTIPANRYFNLVVWGVANKTGEYEPMVINLPSGFYVSQADAEADVDGYDDFDIPVEFSTYSSTGFLVCRMTIKMGTTWDVVATVDLRGKTVQSAAGGISGITTEFSDSQFKVFDDADITKILALDASGITTGNTRTIAVPDEDANMLVHTGVKVFDFTPRMYQPPAADYAEVMVWGTRDTLAYDDGTEETAFFEGVIQSFYDSTKDTRVYLLWMADDTSGNNVKWDLAFKDCGVGSGATDVDTGFASELTVTDASDIGSARIPLLVYIDFDNSEMDSVSANELFRLKVMRDVGVASNMAEDAQLLRVWGVQL